MNQPSFSRASHSSTLLQVMFLVSRENWGTESGLRAIETNPQRNLDSSPPDKISGDDADYPRDSIIKVPLISLAAFDFIRKRGGQLDYCVPSKYKPLSSLAIFHASPSHDVQLDGGWPSISCHRADYLVSTIVCIRVEKNMFLISWEIWLPLPRSFGDDSSVGIRCRLSKSEAIMGRKINGISCNNIMNDYM